MLKLLIVRCLTRPRSPLHHLSIIKYLNTCQKNDVISFFRKHVELGLELGLSLGLRLGLELAKIAYV